ncbi:MAG: branched-chain amino acid aminotransferase [Myxococcota bacterium]|nr:branched-chain amino acid aminotransferase [Myxococcota bacterium]
MVVSRTEHPKPRPRPEELGFGRYFTDHMFSWEYTAGRGWHDPQILPYGPIQLDPAAGVLHYGQAMFEGMKAFRGVDGRVRLFRLRDHCLRMQRGAPRLCMPPVDAEGLAAAVRTLVALDADWVPAGPFSALYVRPVLVATEPYLGVRPAERYRLLVILSPVTAYYGDPLQPVRIWVETEDTRAPRGGLGAVKAAANYVASLRSAQRARQHGCAQVLWLDGAEHRFVEEVGTMNLFVLLGEELVTPPLSDSILGGVTRQCVLRLARDLGLQVSERPLALDELREAHRSRRLTEVFGTGTAAVITPVGELAVGGERLVIGQGEPGRLTRWLFEEITGIQRGLRRDRYGWLTDVA